MLARAGGSESLFVAGYLQDLDVEEIVVLLQHWYLCQRYSQLIAAKVRKQADSWKNVMLEPFFDLCLGVSPSLPFAASRSHHGDPNLWIFCWDPWRVAKMSSGWQINSRMLLEMGMNRGFQRLSVVFTGPKDWREHLVLHLISVRCVAM